ncbi:MAG: hypothetical protein K2L14_08675 [Duncaniella sp.]|nr:hypothetical protein [Duncaniella sp.]
MNKTARDTALMSPLRFEQICEYFKNNGLTKISIMGGEPTMHPNFAEICKIAQSYFQEVYVFTNGIRGDVLSEFHPRNTDAIVYNFLFIEQWSDITFLHRNRGKRIIDVVIDNHTDINKLKSSLIKLIRFCPVPIEIQLVINNSINIFKYRGIIADKITTIYNFLSSTYPTISTIFQCGAPLCFTHGLKLPPFVYRTICPSEAVLIDGSCNVRFCNIHTEKLVPLFFNNNIIPFKILKNHIYLQNLKNQYKSLDKICVHCLYYSTQCNGKCYVSQDFIHTSDIINNTDVLWLKQLKI